MSELKPCPFCGARPLIQVGLSAFKDVQIGCDACGAAGPNHDDKLTAEENRAEAITAWNTRAEGPRTKPSQEVVERLDAAFQDEIRKVSTLAFNSNSVCRDFYERLRERFRGALLASFSDAPSDGGA